MVDNSVVQRYYANIPSLDVRGNVFSECRQYFSMLSWEQTLLGKALNEMASNANAYDVDDLQISVALMMRAVHECSARVRSVFSIIVNKIELPPQVEIQDDGHQHPECIDVAGTERSLSCVADTSGNLDSASTPGDSDRKISNHVSRLRAVCASVIDDIKDLAFTHTFVDSTLLYCSLARDFAVEIDVEVHGANTFLALLRATAGIRLRRIPLLSDDVKGVADGFEVGLEEEIRHLWLSKQELVNKGSKLSFMNRDKSGGVDSKDVETAISGNSFVTADASGLQDTDPKAHKKTVANTTALARLHHTMRPMRSHVGQSSSFIWRRLSCNASEFANNAVDASVENAPHRARFAIYLANFCSYFMEDVLFPRLITALTTDTFASEAFGVDVIMADLCTLFEEMKSLSSSKSTSPAIVAAVNTDECSSADFADIPADLSDPRLWLWDIEAYPPVLNKDNARLLFRYLGVLKPQDWRADLEGTCSLHKKNIDKELVEIEGDESFPDDVMIDLRHGRRVDPSSILLESRDKPSMGGRGGTGPQVIPRQYISLQAAGDIRGGGTGREVLENLLNSGKEPWNKWLHPCTSFSWVVAEFVPHGKAYFVYDYGLCSGNDAPDRDPVKWNLYGRTRDADYSESWTLLHSVAPGNGQEFEYRFQWLWFKLPEEVRRLPLVAVKLDIVRSRRSLAGVQLSHFHIKGVEA